MFLKRDVICVFAIQRNINNTQSLILHHPRHVETNRRLGA